MNYMSNCAAPLISVIIPVYKTEAYLEKCVRSVMMQSYHNLEIILVDDGSPDNCPLICDHLAEEDARIKVIHKMNGGLSDARNKGMEICKGDYLFFADSDDYVRRDALELLLEVATSKDIDLVCGDYCLVNEDGECIDHGLRYPNCELTLEEAIEYFITKDWGAWGKLYRRSVHSEVRFPIGKIHEDEAIMLQILSRCKKIALISDELYFYLKRSDSITSQVYSKRKMDWFYGWKENTRFIKQNYPQFLSQCLSKTWDTAIYNIDHLISGENNTTELSEIRKFALYYRNEILRSHKISCSRKLRLWLFLHSDLMSISNLYYRVYHAIGRV